MLNVEKLSFSYGDLQVLWGVDLEVRQGEIVTVVGANGAGKSTLLRAVSRLAKARSGRITFAGTELKRLASHEVVELGIVQVPEARRIFPEMTVLENLRMGSFVKATRKDRERNMERVFSLFPRLEERQKQLGGTMSGGEQQMLAIARGLMGNPKLLLLDEPSLGREHLRDHQRDQSAGYDHPARRAERLPIAAALAPGLRARDRTRRALRHRRGAARRCPREEGLPRHLKLETRLSQRTLRRGVTP
jgi:branched-chain amino acid transport system ATP-binding protein